MANVFDYLDWRDISLNNVEFNEIDGLIMSCISYFPFDNLINEKEEKTLNEIYKKYMKIHKELIMRKKEDIEFYPILSKSKRFGNIKFTNFINKLDKTEEKQFAAVTSILPDNTIFISYRGTDNTIIALKEDMNMCFSEVIPAQIDAVKYLEDVALKYPSMKIRLGGHSKGGNLAVYAAAFCSDEIKNRIINIYNMDGPGFCDRVIESKNYKDILNKIHTYIPQSSIIGRLLNHKEKTTIVKSTQNFILQHNTFTWELLGDKFINAEITNSSEFIDTTLTNWLKSVDVKQREKFIDILFEIVNATGANTVQDIEHNKLETAKIILKTYKNIDDESKEILTKTLNVLFSVAKSNVKVPKINIKKSVANYKKGKFNA